MKKSAEPASMVQSNDIAISLDSLIDDVRLLVRLARQTIVTIINLLQVHTNYEIGRLILEYEQHGLQRAAYG
jgi:hypothetical protein